MDLESVEPVLRSAEETAHTNRAKIAQSYELLRRLTEILETFSRRRSTADLRQGQEAST